MKKKNVLIFKVMKSWIVSKLTALPTKAAKKKKESIKKALQTYLPRN